MAASEVLVAVFDVDVLAFFGHHLDLGVHLRLLLHDDVDLLRVRSRIASRVAQVQPRPWPLPRPDLLHQVHGVPHLVPVVPGIFRLDRHFRVVRIVAADNDVVVQLLHALIRHHAIIHRLLSRHDSIR